MSNIGGNNPGNFQPSPHSAPLAIGNLNGLQTGQARRSRSGTVSSTFLNPLSVDGSSSSISGATSPQLLAQHDSLGLPKMDAISISPTPSSRTIDTSGIQNGGTRRVRSGSLFSTNSIWNDDVVRGNSPSRSSPGVVETGSLHSLDGNSTNAMNSAGGNNFLSPLVSSQHSSATLNGTNNSSLNKSNQRNRSYTTTAAVPNINVLPAINPVNNSGDNSNSRLMPNSFSTSSGPLNDMNSLLENFMTNANNSVPYSRNRSQTYSGTPGALPEATLQSYVEKNVFNNHDTVFDHQLNPHNIQHQSSLQQPSHQSQQLKYNLQQQVMNQDQPLLLDNFDLSHVMLTTNFENPSLGPTKVLLLDNLPQFMDAVRLWTILTSSLGSQRPLGVSSVRLTSTNNSKLALIETSSVEIAMTLKASFNHLEIVPGITLYVAFAKVTENASTRTETQVQKPRVDSRPQPTDVFGIKDSLLATMSILTGSNPNIDKKKILCLIDVSLQYDKKNYKDNFGPLPEPIPLRQLDSPKLRDLRKRLEATESEGLNSFKDSMPGLMTQFELEEFCLSIIDEFPELCYDYLGNTIVQKLFTVLESPFIKLLLVKEISPYLTQLGIHKNGTWAIQKIINLSAANFQQQQVISTSLKPYAVKLFNDQFGNYVLQGCVKFGSPFNDFIFETMLDNFTEISFGRFGARCIRTILETASDSDVVSEEQVLMVASLIVQFANELAVNNNGSLLVTWFLDSFNGYDSYVDRRYEVLTSKFLPNLGSLCVHKLASLTVLKMLNNKADFNSKKILMEAIFGHLGDYGNDDFTKQPSTLLRQILTEGSENTSGPLFIYKVLSNPSILGEDGFGGARYQYFVVSQVRRVLMELNIQNFHLYKKLMDEVGLVGGRLGRSPSFGRKSKRNGKTSKQQQNHQHGQAQSQVVSSYLNPPLYQHSLSNPLGGGISSQFSAISPKLPSHTQLQQRQNYESTPQGFYQQSQELAVMQQLEQLSISSAALGYNSHSHMESPRSMAKNNNNL